MPEHQIPFRRLLMLQGPVGPFFWLLGRELRFRGVDVHKINLNGGDSLFYPGPRVRAYRGHRRDWPAYLHTILGELDIDAIALFGDMRRYHRKAIAVARQRDIPVFVFEEGYLRPDHITVEIGGVNRLSPIIKSNIVSFHQSPSRTVDPVVRLGNTFAALAMHSVLYSLAKDLSRVRFWHYRHHKPKTYEEAWPWLCSGLKKIKSARHDRHRISVLLESQRPYFFVPLQVSNDSQVTHHSGFLSVGHFIVAVMKSFARNAPTDHILLIKHHPMDRGHRDYGALIARKSKRLGCADRIVYIHGGHLPMLLEQAVGTVTVNSTVGLSSLYHNTPVKVLGQAVYNRPGLTTQCSLNQFWNAPSPVDKAQVKAFMAFLQETCQVNGNFYTGYRRTGVMKSVMDKMADQYDKNSVKHPMMPLTRYHRPLPASAASPGMDDLVGTQFEPGPIDPEPNLRAWSEPDYGKPK